MNAHTNSEKECIYIDGADTTTRYMCKYASTGRNSRGERIISWRSHGARLAMLGEDSIHSCRYLRKKLAYALRYMKWNRDVPRHMHTCNRNHRRDSTPTDLAFTGHLGRAVRKANE